MPGFRGVEYVGPYDHQPETVAGLLARHGLEQALFNLPAGDWASGERGIAILPDRVSEFRGGVLMAARYAQALGCAQVNCLAGIAPAGADHAKLEAIFVDNLKFAADTLAKDGIRLLIEPINPVDMPGFFLTTSRQALAMIDRVGSDNLSLQYDIYHMQVVEGDLARTIETNLERIGHVQFADHPGRHEPGTGEIDIPVLFDLLDRLGYIGWVGAEYRPKAGTVEGLGWMARP